MSKHKSPSPIVETHDKGEVRYTAACIPPEPESWKFRLGDPVFRARLAKQIQLLDESCGASVRTLFATRVEAMSAELVPENQLPTSEFSLNGRLLRCYAETPAEGRSLPPGTGFMMPAAGCLLGVAVAHQKCVGFHGGLASLVDFERIRGGTPRRNESIIDAVVNELAVCGIRAEDIHFDFYFGYAPNDYRLDRPEFADFNQALYSDLRERLGGGMQKCTGMVELGLIAKLLAEKRKVGSARIRQILASGSGFALTREPGELGTSRNGVFLLHHAR